MEGGPDVVRDRKRMQQVRQVGGCPAQKGLVDDGQASEYYDGCEVRANLPGSKEYSGECGKGRQWQSG